jgi:hypothetical protein
VKFVEAALLAVFFVGLAPQLSHASIVDDDPCANCSASVGGAVDGTGAIVAEDGLRAPAAVPPPISSAGVEPVVGDSVPAVYYDWRDTCVLGTPWFIECNGGTGCPANSQPMWLYSAPTPNGPWTGTGGFTCGTGAGASVGPPLDAAVLAQQGTVWANVPLPQAGLTYSPPDGAVTQLPGRVGMTV